MRSSHADVISSLANGDLTDDSIKVIEETMANIADNINKQRKKRVDAVFKRDKNENSFC